VVKTDVRAAAICAAMAWLVYWLTAVCFHHVSTPPDAYFNHLAGSFLAHRLDLIDPPATWDLSNFHGRWYIPFPPLPAIVMMPLVAFAGVDAINTTLFCTIAGATAVAFVFLLLDGLSQRRWTTLSQAENLWLTALFAFGTVNWWMSTTGSVWYVDQVTTSTFIALATMLAVRGAPPVATGASLGLAICGRPPVIGIAFLIIVIHGMVDEKFRVSWPALMAFAAPVLVAITALALYNQRRFGTPTDFGYLYAANLSGDGQMYGQLNLHFLKRNLWFMFLAGPEWNAARGIWAPSRTGMSVFLTTPAFLLIFTARRPTRLAVGAWLAAALGVIPALLYYTTGAHQFGSRFTLDITIPMLVLVALSVRDGLSRVAKAAILLSIAANALGAAWWHWPR